MEYCSKCDRPINGFNYGYGVNPVCGTCNDQEILTRLLIRKLKHEQDV